MACSLRTLASYLSLFSSLSYATLLPESARNAGGAGEARKPKRRKFNEFQGIPSEFQGISSTRHNSHTICVKFIEIPLEFHEIH